MTNPDLGAGSYAFGLLAGSLSTLSPCVFPIAPILLGSAAQAHRWAPLALAGGLALSYAVIGTSLAWAGSSVGLDVSALRGLGAVLLGLLGLVLMSGSLQQRFAGITAGIGNAGSGLLDRFKLDGVGGQFGIGLLLGLVWSPCVGPTLGAAIVLASQGSQLPQVMLLMGLFGLGAALPLLLLAGVSRAAMARWRGRLMLAGKAGKTMLGGALVLMAAVILLGADKTIETWVLEHSPEWLTSLTTRL